MREKEHQYPREYVKRMKIVEQLVEESRSLCYSGFTNSALEEFLNVPENHIVFKLFIELSEATIDAMKSKEATNLTKKKRSVKA